MYEVAKQAGVGQATLYRHFPDRSVLAAAVGTELLEEIEQAVRERGEGPEAFDDTMLTMTRVMVRAPGLIRIVRENGEAYDQGMRRRLLDALGDVLRDGQAVGRVRPDITPEDLILFMTMVEGIMSEVASPSERLRAAERGLDLVLRGVVVA